MEFKKGNVLRNKEGIGDTQRIVFISCVGETWFKGFSIVDDLYSEVWLIEKFELAADNLHQYYTEHSKANSTLCQAANDLLADVT